MVKLRVVLVHGWRGAKQGHWMHWLEKELKTRDVDVVFPTLPNPDLPKQGEWVSVLT